MARIVLIPRCRFLLRALLILCLAQLPAFGQVPDRPTDAEMAANTPTDITRGICYGLIDDTTDISFRADTIYHMDDFEFIYSFRQGTEITGPLQTNKFRKVLITGPPLDLVVIYGIEEFTFKGEVIIIPTRNTKENIAIHKNGEDRIIIYKPLNNEKNE